jgi:hypothetical protein
MLNRSEILDNLNKATDEEKINWKISIDREFVRAEYEFQTTETKKIRFRIVYYVNHPKTTKLFIEYDKRKTYATIVEQIIEIGGKNNKIESRKISQLIQKILLKNDKYKNIKIEIYNDEINVGDKVIVVVPKRELTDTIVQLAKGEKGTVIEEIEDITGEKFLLVQFDQKFMEQMVSANFAFGEESLSSEGDCWPFEPKFLRKISDDKKYVMSSQDEYIGSL